VQAEPCVSRWVGGLSVFHQPSAGVHVALLLGASHFAADEKRGGFPGHVAQFADGLEVGEQRPDVWREVVGDQAQQGANCCTSRTRCSGCFDGFYADPTTKDTTVAAAILRVVAASGSPR
jgi:hypothetical protein